MLCIGHDYLLQSEKVALPDRKKLAVLYDGAGTETDMASSLQLLCRALEVHHGRPAILLIDEYDVPINHAVQKKYGDEMMDFMRTMLGAALKTNPSLKFAMLTGCLRIARENIFTGLNNCTCFGISDDFFADKFGFTSDDVDGLLASIGMQEKKKDIKDWYDGYCFGQQQEMYCPWDVMQYLYDLQRNPKARPQAYWNNTSSKVIVKSFVGRTDLNIGEKFEALINGDCVEAKIVEPLTFDSLHASEDNLWSVLYLTGYLTRASKEQMQSYGKKRYPGKELLVIPNIEVGKIYFDSIAEWFTDYMQGMDRKPLFDAFWNGDAESFTRLCSQILMQTISYHDYGEDFYHAVLTGMFVASGHAVASNREAGLGRSDIIVKDRRNMRAAVIEVKCSCSAAALPLLAREALEQIATKEYDVELLEEYDTIVRWGITLYKKRCLAQAGDIFTRH